MELSILIVYKIEFKMGKAQKGQKEVFYIYKLTKSTKIIEQPLI